MFRQATLLVLALALVPSQFTAAEEFEIGGPLAGVKLNLVPTQHGEEPGHPGCIPQLIEQGKPFEDMGHVYREWGPQGQSPEWQLYEGSVEHWRAYMLKYLPLRSFFDRQSQRKNFVAPNLPGAAASQAETYAEPIYWVPRHDDPRPTGRFAKAVPVVRMKLGAPVLQLDLGELERGVYAVRVIGAVETERVRPFREPLFMRMTVHDGLGGETSDYRLRLGYCDQFYSVAEFYFHAPAPRRYRAELAVDRGSTVDLLVHNVSLDDVLAGTLRQPIKHRPTIASSARPAGQTASPGRKPVEPLAREDRLRRDAAIWNGFPPLNAQASELRVGHGGYGSIRGVRAGSAELTGEQIEQQYGRWVPPQQAGDLRKRPDWRDDDVFLANPQLGLVYTFEDLRRHRPLPDPYPLKDDGAGLYFPDPQAPDAGAAWTPIGARVHDLYREYYSNIGRSLGQYQQRGDADAAHDAAITLVRFAYAFPTLDHAEYLSNTLHDPGPFGRDASCRRRFTEANFLPHYPLYVKPIMFQYDELFDAIRNNQRLAESVGRFVPWVKTPEDVIELIDVYLVQTTAKRIMRYHYNTDVVDLANLAAVVGNRDVTDPWMEWLFSRTFIYPLPVAGVQDVMISGCTREGTEVVGSTYYAQEEGAARVAASLDLYLRTGGNTEYALSDARRYPKPVAHAFWRIENVVAGADFLRIGDVCGPDKGPGHTLRDLGFARNGWQWTRDPRFAFVLRHFVGRQDESDAEWAEIEQAAARQSRAPWLDNRSRVLPMWAGVLEAGREHDDYRFRRAAYLRLGFGMGHQHDDALDLQIVTHGLPMTIDGGQRPGYSVPGDRTTRVHNVVQVDGHPAFGHSWATALADFDGARYLAANAAPPEGIGLMRRQMALIDADEGRRSQTLPPEKQLPGAELPAGVSTPNSYVFDVFRVDGGQQHTYCFHGPLNDQFTWNATNEKPPTEGSAEAEYLSRFSGMPDLNRAADCPPVLEATWRMQRDVEGPGLGEKELLGRNFDPNGPPKFTRLHLFGAADSRALRGEFVCRQWNYHFTNVMVRTPAAEQLRPRMFAALVEPFVGEPFLIGRRELQVPDNDPDARRAVALEVKTAAGHTDVCFADDRRDKTREIPDAGLKVSGEFAFYSTDDRGLRQATLAGGRSLESRLVRITTEAAERRGRVTRVDYLDRKSWIDSAWPQRGSDVVLEVGVPDHWTTYTATAIEPAGAGSLLQLQRGGDYFRSQITHLDPSGSTVTTSLRPLIEYINHNRNGWVASDDAGKNFWRAAYLGEGRFRLDGPPLSAGVFGDAGVLRLWEYGVGDQVRQSTSISLRRTDDRTYECLTDISATVSLPGRSVTFLPPDTPQPPSVSAATNGWVSIQVSPAEHAVRFRVEP
jgi:hypothetical protein